MFDSEVPVFVRHLPRSIVLFLDTFYGSPRMPPKDIHDLFHGGVC